MGDILYSREGLRFGIAANVQPDTTLYLRTHADLSNPGTTEQCVPDVAIEQPPRLYPSVAIPRLASSAMLSLDEPKIFIELIRTERSIIAAVARTEREIALTQEYRMGPTAVLVAGKLDVREAAVKLNDLPTDTAANPITDEAQADIATEEIEE